MQTNFDFQNESQFDAAYESLMTSNDFKRLQSKFEVKPFYFKFKDLKKFFVGLSWFIQAVTVAVSFMAISGLIAPMMNVYLAYLFSSIALIGIEGLKRLSFRPAVKEYLQFQKVAAFGLIMAFGMLGISLWLTWNGTHEAITTLTDAPTLLNVDSLTGYEKVRIKELTTQLTDVKKTQSWKGVLTPKGQTSYNRITDQIAKLQDKLDSKETDLTFKNDKTATDHTTKTLQRSTHFRFLTLALDLILFVLLAWLEYYDFRSLTEFSRLANAMRTPSVKGGKNANAMRNDAIRDTEPFSFNTGRVVIQGFRKQPTQCVTEGEVITVKKACQHCGESFERKTTFQKYCCEVCRVTAWELRTGKRLNRKVK